MAIFNMSFSATRVMINTLRKALVSDPLFQPDKTGPSRSAETIVLDAWGYQVRDFPCLVVIGKPGKFRRMGIGDQVGNYFGVNMVEEAGGSATSRTFDVPLALPVEAQVTIGYQGDPTGLSPAPPWSAVVQQKTVGGLLVNYLTLAGANVVCPAANLRPYCTQYPTGMIFGGFYDMTMEFTASGRNTQSRDLLTDRVAALLWLEKKRELRKNGVIVMDVQPSGFAQIPYGADQIYQSKLVASISTEFEAIAQYTETVTAIDVVVTAIDVVGTAVH